jgi:hypothetical protein
MKKFQGLDLIFGNRQILSLVLSLPTQQVRAPWLHHCFKPICCKDFQTGALEPPAPFFSQFTLNACLNPSLPLYSTAVLNLGSSLLHFKLFEGSC